MPELPSGTVTFLFSDIEGSTRLLQEYGDRWPDIVERHNELLRGAFDGHGGVELGTEGDSFFVVFPSAPSAIAAAVAAQRGLLEEAWPGGARVRARMGLHTGEAVITGGTYIGLDVHRAARIMAAGHGGGVLVSGTTEALVRNALPSGVTLGDLGDHRLRDLPGAERLYAVVADGLPDDLPPPRSLGVGVTNLPTQLTSFIGRDEETARVREILTDHRIVTLTGPGGTGKTRLSLHVAEGAMAAFPDGIWFVPLGQIREVELVLPSIGQIVGLVDPGRQPLERMAEHIGGRRMLLVLDNLEQVIAAAADLAELIARASGLSILATSRSALRVYGEHVFAVPPLRLPDPRELPADVGITRYPAVALFVDRARAVRADFAVTLENAPAVAEVCWRLDGLPLAIELAAARIRILTPQAMASRLESHLDLGGSGARDRPERQQTLRGAIAWSYDLLDDAERWFFAGLSVFRGGADLEAMEAVMHANGTDALESVDSMLDKSLLRQTDEPDGSTRFQMLETIREYAHERLDASDDAESVRRAHAVYYLALAERLSAQVMGQDQRDVLDAMERDHDNLRAAIAWCVGQGEVDMALRFLPSCWRFWHMRGHTSEAAERARRILALPGTAAHPRELVRAVEASGGIAYWQGDFETARADYGIALELQREHGDDAEIANALYNLSMSYVIDVQNVQNVQQPVDPEAEKLVDEALAIYRRLGDRHGEGRVLWAGMGIRIFRRSFDEARDLGRECLEIFEGADDRFMLAWTRYMLGTNENLAGDPNAARVHIAEALSIFQETEDLSGYALAIDGFAASAFLRGEMPLAMRLAGAANAIQHAGGTQLGLLNRQWTDFHPERLLSDPALAASYDEGARQDLREILDLALGVTAT
jgi:predicted ATPase/class 3 adenylate cyclase